MEKQINKNQKRLIGVMKQIGPMAELDQPKKGSAAFFVWHPTHSWIRVKIKAREVWQLVEMGIITATDSYTTKRYLIY